MPKTKRTTDPRVINAIAGLNQFMGANGLKPRALAEAAGVSQPQVSKILGRKTKKVSDDLLRLCEYAKIQIEMPPAPLDNARILGAFERAWDGQPETIELIARLIECAAIVREQPARVRVRKH